MAWLIAMPCPVALELGASAEPRTVTGTVEGGAGGPLVQACLVSRELIWHRIWECGFGAWSQHSKRGMVVKEFVSAPKLRGRRKTLSKKKKCKRMNS